MKKPSCPICDRPLDSQGPKEWPDWPFCSKRCRLVDLGRWLNGSYHFDMPLKAEDPESVDELGDSPKPAVPSADPHREKA
jgi:endogenous inhibitor of DNA gyrase (YacG/DUF329 family)